MTSTQTATRPYSADLCVSWREQNMYHDSYFHATWWNGERFETAEIGATAYAGGTIPHANAPQELKDRYTAWRNSRVAEIVAERDEELRRAIVKGAFVTVIQSVTRGKNKIAAGEAGIVFWTGTVNNDPWHREGANKDRAGILVTDENGAEKKIYIDAERIRVQGFEGEELPLKNDAVQFAFAMSYPSARNN